LVTNIRTGVTARESLLRHDQAKLSQVWSQRELEERNAALIAYENISKEWEKVEKLKGPFQLHEVLMVNPVT
jgi:dynein regulatory complex protein 1